MKANVEKMPRIAAFSDMDCQVILSVGRLVPPEALGTLPDHMSVFQSVDQIAVLEKADLFLSHCGMNSVNESLYYKASTRDVSANI